MLNLKSASIHFGPSWAYQILAMHCSIPPDCCFGDKKLLRVAVQLLDQFWSGLWWPTQRVKLHLLKTFCNMLLKPQYLFSQLSVAQPNIHNPQANQAAKKLFRNSWHDFLFSFCFYPSVNTGKPQQHRFLWFLAVSLVFTQSISFSRRVRTRSFQQWWKTQPAKATLAPLYSLCSKY